MASGPVETEKASTGSDALSSSEGSSRNAASSTRQSRVRRREAAIIDAARERFTSHGFGGTTMAMIAREAGVADGTLYTYFDNKEALARAVISDFYARLTESAQQAVETRRTTRTRLEALARNHLERIIDERGIVDLLPLLTTGYSDYAGSDLYNFNKTYVAVFDRVVREGRAGGEIDAGAKVRVLRDIFFGALEFGAKSLLVRPVSKSTRKADVTRLVDSLVSMMVGAGGSASLADRLEAVANRMEATLDKS